MSLFGVNPKWSRRCDRFPEASRTYCIAYAACERQETVIQERPRLCESGGVQIVAIALFTTCLNRVFLIVVGRNIELLKQHIKQSGPLLCILFVILITPFHISPPFLGLLNGCSESKQKSYRSCGSFFVWIRWW